MSVPLVSICLPNLNTRPFLEERLTTILAQTFTDWELIVGDSFSDDGSWEFLQKFAGDPRIHLHQVPREGIYAGWNECLKRARGQFVYIATSDDTAQPQLLERLLVPLHTHRDIHVAVCDYQAIDESGKPQTSVLENEKFRFFGDWLHTPSIRNGKTEFLLHACFGTVWGTMTAVLFRRTLLKQTGLFRLDRGSQADVEWSMRAALGSDIAFVPGRLATWRSRQGQATSNNCYTHRFVRTLLDCLESVLHDSVVDIPDRWKLVKQWDQEITSLWRAEYLDSFHLYRGSARENPKQFLSNIGSALRDEPGFLIKQLFRGFPWSPEMNPDHVGTARRLITLFDAPWPPRPNAWINSGSMPP